MANLYTPKRICDQLGISQSALRIYTDKYGGHLTKEARTPPRKFWEDDLKLLAFVISKTKEGSTHDQVLGLLETEEGKAQLQEFKDDWEPTVLATEPAVGNNTALVPIAQVQAMQSLLQDAQRREQQEREQAAQREHDLQEQINQLLRELGHKEGELEALRKSKPKGFWARLLGGE